MLPPEARHGRIGDKCWPRDQSITENDDEGQKDEKKERRWREQEKEERCRDLANRVPHCCSRQTFMGHWMRDISKINNKPDILID